MAAAAGSGYVAVIKACTQPGIGVMAVITFSSSLYMRGVLACCGNTVMTTTAGARNIAVIETGIAP